MSCIYEQSLSPYSRISISISIPIFLCKFQTSFADNTAMFFTNLIYVVGFLIQIFLMCTFGQELISECDLLSYRFFSSNWPEILAASKWNDPKNCHKVLIIFSESLQQEQKIMIGKVFPLSLATFSSVSIENFIHIHKFMT